MFLCEKKFLTSNLYAPFILQKWKQSDIVLSTAVLHKQQVFVMIKTMIFTAVCPIALCL